MSQYKLARGLIFQSSSLAFCLMLGTTAQAESTRHDNIRKAGDALQFLLPLTAYGATAIYKDGEGAIQYTKSGVTAIGTVAAWKGLSGKLRPDGQSPTSFPSGHTAGAFSGASFLYTRYGRGWGIPAYALAAFTGYSRVHADAHHADDVVAGASVAMFSNWFFVSPMEGRVSVMPEVSSEGVGVQVSVKDTNGAKRKRHHDTTKRLPFRYSLVAGPAFLVRNQVLASPDANDTFDMFNFEKTNDPTTTAWANFEVDITRRSELLFSFAPFEARDYGAFTNPVSFAGTTFPADVRLRSRYRLYDFSTLWRYDLTPGKKSYWGLDVQVGAALNIQRTVIQLENTEGVEQARADDNVVLPVLHALGRYPLSQNWDIVGELNAMYLSNDQYTNSSLSLRYTIDRHWDASFGYLYYNRDIETSTLKNRVTYDVAMISLGYSF